MNVARNERITLNELVSELNKDLGENILPAYSEPILGDVEHSFANIELGKEKLGFKVGVRFSEGISYLLSNFSISC